MKNKSISILFVLLLTFILVFTTGCNNNNNNNNNNTASVYIEMAQDYINEGNYEAAIEVLEKGMSSTGSTKIEELLKEVIALQLQEAPASNNTPDDNDAGDVFDYSVYEGTWAQEGIGWEYGGLLMDVEVSDDTISIDCIFTQGAPSSRIAEIAVDIKKDDVENNAVECAYDDDGWGSCGKLNIQFNDNSIKCSFSDIKQLGTEIPAWGFYEDTYTLIKNNEAHDSLIYSMDDYYELYPEENPDNWEPQLPYGTYIYNSNGLLSVSETNIYMQNEAVLYVSISYTGSVSWECDSNIVALKWGEWDATNTIPLYITGVQNGTAVLKIFDANYPNECIYIDVNVSGLSTTGTVKASNILSNMGVSEEEFRANCQRLFTSGIQIGSPDGTEAYYMDIVEYPRNYIDKWFVIDNLSGYDFTCTYKGMSNDGYPYYECVDDYDYSAVIYDFRNDTYSPNISRDDHFTPYVIFKEVRTINGEEWLVFWMISMDK